MVQTSFKIKFLMLDVVAFTCWFWLRYEGHFQQDNNKERLYPFEWRFNLLPNTYYFRGISGRLFLFSMLYPSSPTHVKSCNSTSCTIGNRKEENGRLRKKQKTANEGKFSNPFSLFFSFCYLSIFYCGEDTG